jgi:hypothetical protein
VAIILPPQRWTKQPQYPVSVRSDVSIALTPGVDYCNRANGIVSTATGTLTGSQVTVNNDGKALQMHPAGGSNGIATLNIPAPDLITTDCTVIWLGLPDNISSANGQLAVRAAAVGAGWDILLAYTASANLQFSYVDASPAQFDVTLAVTGLATGRIERVCGVKRGNTLEAYDWRTRSSATSSGGAGTFRSPGFRWQLAAEKASGNGAGHNRCTGFFVLPVALPQAEVWEILDNPWQLFDPLPRRIFVGPAAGPGAYELIAQVGSYTLTGQSATLLKTNLLTANNGSYTLTGQSADLTWASAGAYELTAQAGSYSLTGQTADLTWAAPGAYVLTAQAGSYALTGQSATLLKSNLITASNGSYTLTGQSATLTWAAANAYVLTAQAGSYALNGQNATLTNSGEVITAAQPQVGIDWGALVQKSWGKEYGKPEYEYEFSNGRRFLEKKNPYS